MLKLLRLNIIMDPHYNDVIMGAIASQITSLTIVYSTVYSDADQRKHQSSASLAFVRGIDRAVNSPHKWPTTRKMFPFDDVIMGASVSIPASVVRSLADKHIPERCGILVSINRTVAWWRHQMETFSASLAICAITGHRWIPHTKASDAELWDFLWSAPE